MAKNRYSGKGSLVKVNTSGDDTTFVTIGFARNITPPGQVKGTVDLTGMEDTDGKGDTGMPEITEFSFQTLEDPEDQGDIDLQSLYNNDTEVAWQIVTPRGTETWTRQFTGKIRALEPQGFGGNDALMQQVTVIRTGAITNTVA